MLKQLASDIDPDLVVGGVEMGSRPNRYDLFREMKLYEELLGVNLDSSAFDAVDAWMDRGKAEAIYDSVVAAR